MKVKMKATFLLTASILSLNLTVSSQTIVQDKANNGQLKRMVYRQWNDWQPTPATGWTGLPKNPAGWAYWRVLHHAYWSGEDKRPWKTGGQFQQNYLSLVAQQKLDKQMVDTTNKMMEVNVATALSMTGGAADVPYHLYFKDKFDNLFTEVMNYFRALQQLNPTTFNEMVNSSNGKKYIEFLDVQKDRIETINGFFVDRGARMVSYFKILSVMQPMCTEIKAYVWSYIALEKLPPPQKIRQQDKTGFSLENNDEEIVKELLKDWKTK